VFLRELIFKYHGCNRHVKIEEREKVVSWCMLESVCFKNGELHVVVYLGQGDNLVYVVGFEKQA